MADLFRAEIVAYERDLLGKIGAEAARDAARELSAHLDADYCARIEVGIAPDLARSQTLAAIGDLRAAANEEHSFPSTIVAGVGLVGATILMLTAWFLPSLFPTLPSATLRLGLMLAATACFVPAAIFGVRSNSKPQMSLTTLLVGGIPPALILGAYLNPMRMGRSADTLVMMAMALATITMLVLGAVGRRIAWTAGLLMGGAIFVAQLTGVELSLRAAGARPGYPLDITLGTWLVFTLPLLLLSGIGARIAVLTNAVRARLRGATR